MRLVSSALDPTGSEGYALELSDASRVFISGGREVAALLAVNLTVSRHAMIAVTGPSGSGKTTLLSIAGGLDRPTTGEVVVLGQSLAALSEGQLTAFRAHHIGIVFQDPHLLPGLTALENVVVGSLPWANRRTLEQEARDLLDAVGMAPRADHPPSRLSGGERQRVAIARALLGHRELLLADEPTGNIDARQTDEILALLRRLRDERGLTILVCTHDAAVAAAADRVLQLKDGGLVADDAFDEQVTVEVHDL